MKFFVLLLTAVLFPFRKDLNAQIQLAEAEVKARKLEERSFGIKRRGLLMHFADGIFDNKNTSFEIGQLIKLEEQPVKLTSMKLYLLNAREDSADFRIRFYHYREGKPADRAVTQPISQRKAIEKGWLNFDLSPENIRLSGDILASVEILPDSNTDADPISYEIKLGGSSKSYYRKGDTASWSTPPHHYCLNVTGLVNPEAPVMPDEDVESKPDFHLRSKETNTEYSLYVALPEGCKKKSDVSHPLILLLDANAYFDQVKDFLEKQSSGTSDKSSPILVGIGYENAYLMDSLRVRDYTFPEAAAADSFAVSGGADQFHRFLRGELLPELKRRYRIQEKDISLAGHSFGAYFALYAFEKAVQATPEETRFNRYIAASPSIQYQNGYIIEQLTRSLNQLALSPAPEHKPLLYLTIGDQELDPDTSALFNELKRIMENSAAVVEGRTTVYESTGHMGTAIRSFEDALRQ